MASRTLSQPVPGRKTGPLSQAGKQAPSSPTETAIAHQVTVVENEASLSLCRAALSGQPLLALDCEGVNLGRRGEVALIFPTPYTQLTLNPKPYPKP